MGRREEKLVRMAEEHPSKVERKKGIVPASYSFDGVRTWVEEMADSLPPWIDDVPSGSYDSILLQGLRVDHAERGRIVCSFKVPPRLLNSGNLLHGGAIAALVDVIGSAAIFTTGAMSSGVSVEINMSYLDSAMLGEEIEIEGKVLRIGRAIAVVTVDLRKKKTGRLVAQGRHTKYLAVNSKL